MNLLRYFSRKWATVPTIWIDTETTGTNAGHERLKLVLSSPDAARHAAGAASLAIIDLRREAKSFPETAMTHEAMK